MSGPSFTRGEYWLLETAVTSWMPVRFLDGPDIEVIFNKPGHGLPRDGLLDAMEALSARALVRVETQARGEFVPTRAELAAAVDERHDAEWTHYGLTQAGGAAWEAFAAPDWSRFIEHSMDGKLDADGFDAHEVVGASAERLRFYLATLKTEMRIDEASMVADELRPWSATYWKTLDVGHRLRFRADEGPGWRMRSYDVRDSWYRWR